MTGGAKRKKKKRFKKIPAKRIRTTDLRIAFRFTSTVLRSTNWAITGSAKWPTFYCLIPTNVRTRFTILSLLHRVLYFLVYTTKVCLYFYIPLFPPILSTRKCQTPLWTRSVRSFRPRDTSACIASSLDPRCLTPPSRARSASVAQFSLCRAPTAETLSVPPRVCVTELYKMSMVCVHTL